MFRYRRCLGIIVIILALLGSTGCGAQAGSIESESRLPISDHYFIFDTIVNLRVYDERITPEHFAEMKELLDGIDGKMNRLREGSELDRVNQNAGRSPTPVSDETYRIVSTALQYAAASGGHFDPTVGPLVELWGIGSESAAVPDQQQLADALQLIDYTSVSLDESSHSISLPQAGMSLDLGAIAKGYAADVLAAYLKEQGFESAIIDLGGNILALGAKPDGSSWSIGVQDPEQARGQHLGVLKVKDKTIVTSGVYERFFEEQGKVYHHILSPFDGYPVDNDLQSVTIVTEGSMDADAMSTAAFSLGMQEGRKFIERLETAEAIFVTKDREIYVTSGLKQGFQLTNDTYRLMN